MRPDLAVIHIDVPDDEIIRRLSTRRVCRSCGLTQSVSMDEAVTEACPYCGGTLVRREDDNAETRTGSGWPPTRSRPVRSSITTGRDRTFVRSTASRQPDKVSEEIFRGSSSGSALPTQPPPRT